MLLPPFAFLLIVVAITGFAAGPINPIINVVLYQRIPKAMRARVFGLVTAGVLVAMPLGSLLAGFALESIGLVPTLLVYGVIYTSATLMWFILPVTKELDEPAPAS